MNWSYPKIAEIFLVTDYVANGSFASLKENVQYSYERDYAVLVRTTDNTNNWNGKYVFVNQKSYEFLAKSKLFPNDLVISNVGEPGKAFLCPDLGVPMTLGPNAILVRPVDIEKVDPKYFYYYTISRIGQSQIEKISSATTQKKFNKTSYRDLQIPLPPLPIQLKIAAILDAADAYRQKTKALIEKYDQLTQSLFLEMFGDPVRNEKGWEIVNLDDITSKITDGVHLKPTYTDEGVPFISVKNITTGFLDFTDCKFISASDHAKYYKRCNPEFLDILYTKVGATYGRPALVDTLKEFSLYVSVALIKPMKNLINPIFLKEAMANPVVKRQADKSIKGIGVPDLHLNMIKKFKIPLPPLTRQNSFAERVKLIQSQKDQSQKTLDKAEILFQSLLQRAFKGELLN